MNCQTYGLNVESRIYSPDRPSQGRRERLETKRYYAAVSGTIDGQSLSFFEQFITRLYFLDGVAPLWRPSDRNDTTGFVEGVMHEVDTGLAGIESDCVSLFGVEAVVGHFDLAASDGESGNCSRISDVVAGAEIGAQLSLNKWRTHVRKARMNTEVVCRKIA